MHDCMEPRRRIGLFGEWHTNLSGPPVATEDVGKITEMCSRQPTGYRSWMPTRSDGLIPETPTGRLRSAQDLDGIITSWNPAAERMFQWTQREAVGQSITIIIPEDRQTEEAEMLDRIRQGEIVHHYETRHLARAVADQGWP